MANTVVVDVSSAENIDVTQLTVSAVQTDTNTLSAVDLSGALSVSVSSVAEVEGISAVTAIDVTG